LQHETVGFCGAVSWQECSATLVKSRPQLSEEQAGDDGSSSMIVTSIETEEEAISCSSMYKWAG
jgi:hypothetical protein